MKIATRMKKGMVMAVVAMVVTSFLANVGEGVDYGDALSKSILFFEGQRSGKLPPNQRVTWRNHSALQDGSIDGVDLVGGYYDAGDNVKFNFPMAFTATMLAWGVLEYGSMMGTAELGHATDAVVWGADYFMKATHVNGVVYAMVGDPILDHNCWERPEDMDTARTPYKVTRTAPGSDLAAEIAASLAAASMVLKSSRPAYAINLIKRAVQVFEFADKNRGIHSDAVTSVCPFYCSSGYEDELVWAAAWIYKATKISSYWDYVLNNMNTVSGDFSEFGWDQKGAGISVLVSQIVMTDKRWDAGAIQIISEAEGFICSLLPESPTKSEATWYTKGGLLFRKGPSNLQHSTSLSFLALTYARYLEAYDNNRNVQCGNLALEPAKLVNLAKRQVDYILGDNPLKMSYMVGYGPKYPQRIHHRGSTLPSLKAYPKRLGCQDGSSYFETQNPNQNVLVGAIVGGPGLDDEYIDSRMNVSMAEPATYINAPIVGVLAYFKSTTV